MLPVSSVRMVGKPESMLWFKDMSVRPTCRLLPVRSASNGDLAARDVIRRFLWRAEALSDETEMKGGATGRPGIVSSSS